MSDDNAARAYLPHIPLTDLEQVLRNPAKRLQTIYEFSRLIQAFQLQSGLTFACFLAAEDQPSSTFSIMPKLEQLMDIRTCVWSRRSDKIISGYKPQPDERGLIVYDVCSTGRTLKEVGRGLHFLYGVVPGGAVVYQNKGHIEELKIVDRAFVGPMRVLAVESSGTQNCDNPSNSRADFIGCGIGNLASGGSGPVPPAGISTDAIEPEKKKGPVSEKKRTIKLVALAAAPVGIYFILCSLALRGYIPQTVVTNIREYVTILSR
jgi:hypothetical protein